MVCKIDLVFDLVDIIYVMNGLQSQNKRPTKLVFSERRTNLCHSVPTLGNPWTYVKQGDVIKFRNPLVLGI